MSILSARVAVAGGLVWLCGCGGSANEDQSASASVSAAITAAATTTTAAPPTTTTLATTTTTSAPKTTAPAFQVAAWKAQWDTGRQGYSDSVSALSNQLTFLLDNNAPDAQIYEALVRLSADVSAAAGAFVAALDAADPIPAERSDVALAAGVLRQAVVDRQQAYGAVAACGEDIDCVNAAFDVVNASTGSIGAAIDGLPTQ